MSSNVRWLPGMTALIALIVSPSALAEEVGQPITIGERLQIESRVLDETREIWVSRPLSYGGGITASDYSRDEHRYAVLYVLDAELHFEHVAATVHFLAGHDRIPELLVVGIPNTDRDRDLLPPLQNPASGADRFLEFLHEELRPWVELNYRTIPYSVIVGHSYGALFVLNALMTEPDAFGGWIAVSPSLTWNNGVLVPRILAFFESTPELDASLFFSIASEGGPTLFHLQRITRLLDMQAPAGLRWAFEPFYTERHGTVPLRAMYRGLESVFDGWDVMDDVYSDWSRFPGIDDIDQLYRRSAERFGIDRPTPYYVVMDYARYLTGQGRLDDAAATILRDPSRYPPADVVLDELAVGFESRDRADDELAYFTRLLQELPENSRISRIVDELENSPGR